MRPRWHRRWRVLVALADTVSVSAALIAVAVARFGFDALTAGFDPSMSRHFAQAPLLLAIPVWLGVFAANRLYSQQRCQNALEEGRRLITAALAAPLALVMVGFLLKENPARSWLFGSMVLGTLATAVGRQTVRGVVSRFRERGKWMTPTVIVGRRQAKSMAEAVLAEPSSGIEPVAICGTEISGIPTWPLTEIGSAVTATGAGEVILVAEDLERHEIAAAIEVADVLPVHVVVLPGLDHLLLGSLHLVSIGHEPGVAVDPPSLHGYQAVAKRTVDVAIAGVALLLTLPLMALACLTIRLESKGPVTFRQRRMGRGGNVFSVIKFRTMHHRQEAEEEAFEHRDLSFLSKPPEDPRVTRAGRILRKTSIDELPQLWNVLRGDMSLVGPRPLPLWEAEALDLRRRLVVRPGITGLWQVSGRSSLSPEERIRLDLVYVQNWNLLLDLSVLLRTVPAVLGRRGAY